MAITLIIKLAISTCYLPHESIGVFNCDVRRKTHTRTLRLEERLEHTITGRRITTSVAVIKVVIVIMFLS
jgi:hypothetical protein